MANQEHLYRLKHSIKKWNQWRRERPEIRPDLSEADLSYLDLNEANFFQANLSDALLTNADLGKANLSEANLHGANLFNVNLSYATLTKANLHETSMWGTVLSHTDLSTTKGLTSINHQGPSHIELYTVQLPQDGSALLFLREVGVPNEWIDFYRAQMMSPIQYHSCFISYAHQDEPLAQRLHHDLQGRGIRCWFAPEDLKIGDKIHSRIDEAIHLYERLLLIFSEHALMSSWVEKEVEAAFEKENRQKRVVLFPVRLDESVMQTTQAWAAIIRRSRHIGDFTRWKEYDAYQQAFTRLLRDLKAGPNLKD